MPEGFAAPRGPSIIELIEAELDKAYAEFIEGRPDDAGLVEDWDGRRGDELLVTRGRCRGLTTALAILHNPYAPNEKAVKRAAKERYESE